MVSARIVLLLATLLCAAAAVASSWEDDNHHHHGGHKSGRCVRRCEDRPWHQRPRCLEQCREEEREKRQERSRHEADDRSGKGSSEDEREREQEKEEKDRRPYVFDRRSFRRVVRSEQGSLRVLRPFDEVSRLLRGIRDYRVAVLEANPRSFVVPSHTDAHCICYVAEGEGVVTTIENGERRSYTIKQGHVFVAPAGAVTYLANTDGRKKLVITKILHTISVPGEFQFFFGPGREEPRIVPVELQQEHPESCVQDLERPSGEAVREAWAGQGDHRACHGGADPRAAAPRLGGRPRPALAPAAVRRVARPLQPPGPAAQHRQPARAALRGRRAQLPRPRRARRQRLLRQHHRGVHERAIVQHPFVQDRLRAERQGLRRDRVPAPPVAGRRERARARQGQEERRRRRRIV
nr:globulin1 - maize [Zea mays]AAB60295.1 truncated globulin1 [Zea mays]